MSPALRLLSLLTACLLTSLARADAASTPDKYRDGEQQLVYMSEEESEEAPEPCVCGVFMSGQLNRTRAGGRRRRHKLVPQGSPVLQYNSEEASFPCGTVGYKHCINRCLDEIIKHLPKSAPLVCSALDRDCHRERAHLFVRNCDLHWFNTNFSAGKLFCCRGGEPVGC